MEVLISVVGGIVLNEVQKVVLQSLASLNNGNNASYLAWNNKDFGDTLVNKYNPFYELTYKHNCNNPQIVFDSIKSKLYQIDIIDPLVDGLTYKKNAKIETNDLVAISWLTNLVVLPFDVYSNVFYIVLNVYETDDYLNIILQSTANSFNNECISFILTKDTQSVSINMTYNYVPMNVYYSFLVSSKILKYDTEIYKFMLNTITRLYADTDEKIKCDINNIKSLTRGFVPQ